MLYVLSPDELTNFRDANSKFSKLLEPRTKYRARNGLTPGTKDIRARCFRKELNENPDEVAKVETMIKRVMDTGSACTIEEELIELDEDQPIPESTTETINPEVPVESESAEP
jgi:TATA-binding protein-associated factor Taf7